MLNKFKGIYFHKSATVAEYNFMCWIDMYKGGSPFVAKKQDCEKLFSFSDFIK